MHSGQVPARSAWASSAAHATHAYPRCSLTVEGNREENVVSCPCCESKLTFDRKRRAVAVTEVTA